MSEWQPIASAPKDGTTVLLWTPASRELELGPYYSDGGCWVGAWFSSPKEIDDGWEDYMGNSPGLAWSPTHWMPLPPPPVAP